ncbi:response regulator [bacterium]|nr:response regulator [bacterium]
MSKRRKVVLVVDDDGSLRSILKEYLTFKGFSCLTCSGYEEAVEWLKENIADIVITDLRMDFKEAGFMLIDWIRNQANMDIPIILMSSVKPANEDSGGYDYFIEKPFSLNEIEKVVKSFFE